MKKSRDGKESSRGWRLGEKKVGADEDQKEALINKFIW
jgi:hypothetical protein